MKKPHFKDSYHHGDLKKALIDATLFLLKEEGYYNLSLRKVAKKAGVSQSAPYRHYQDLEALLVDVAIEGFRMLTENLKKVKRTFAKIPLLQFRESGITYVDFALKNSDLFQIMYGNQIQNHSQFADLIESEESSFQILIDIITNCQESEVLPKNDIKNTAMAAWTMVHGIAVLLLGKQVMFGKTNSTSARKITKEMLEKLYVGLKFKQ